MAQRRRCAAHRRHYCARECCISLRRRAWRKAPRSMYLAGTQRWSQGERGRRDAAGATFGLGRSLCGNVHNIGITPAEARRVRRRVHRHLTAVADPHAMQALLAGSLEPSPCRLALGGNRRARPPVGMLLWAGRVRLLGGGSATQRVGRAQGLPHPGGRATAFP